MLSSRAVMMQLALVAACLLAFLSSPTAAKGLRHVHNVQDAHRMRMAEKRASSPLLEARAADTSGFRFLNPTTSKFKVDALPDVPFNVGEMYSGLMPIDKKNASRALFFVFQPTVGKPVDEITIWSALNCYYDEDITC